MQWGWNYGNLRANELSNKTKNSAETTKTVWSCFCWQVTGLVISSGNNNTYCHNILKSYRWNVKYVSDTIRLHWSLLSAYCWQQAVDLHELVPGVWYLHIIDQFTRFIAGSILSTKKSCNNKKNILSMTDPLLFLGFEPMRRPTKFLFNSKLMIHASNLASGLKSLLGLLMKQNSV